MPRPTDSARSAAPCPRLPRGQAIAAGLLAAAMLAGCGGGSHRSSGQSALLRRLLAYAHCMRSHGVTDFPDPDRQGHLEIDLDPSAPAFQRGLRKCGQIPNDVTPAEENQAYHNEQKVAACMQAHGVPDYPEPKLINGTISISLNSVDPGAPAFQKAMRKCGLESRLQLLGVKASS